MKANSDFFLFSDSFPQAAVSVCLGEAGPIGNDATTIRHCQSGHRVARC